MKSFCRNGPGHQPCAIARCSQQHDNIEYCFQCSEYPCEKYDGIDTFDSFITHRNQLKDFKRVKKIGLEVYHAELAEKTQILKFLLANYNDGRRKSFFCLTVNLLDPCDVKAALEQIESDTELRDLTIKQKAEIAANVFKNIAEQKGIVLKLNKKNK